MIFVDSSVWIDLFRAHSTPATRLLMEHSNKMDLIVGDLVLLEILRGARDHNHAAKLEAKLRRLPIVQTMSPEVAVEGARIYRELRAEGITIRKTVDLAIASFCILNGHALLQSDRDFLPIAERFGLRLA
ncbi:type II toxin-antitoxin system VapC family toxin [Aureimonas psammosilenae]|uniref:type II toxin-antitoxin system VapC family toxin n=1 Tax=Aureimonas psammosilenae TaxID=2495496 RepID=UPI0012607E1E|nr:PIN domain nuclease [Aureimonas psammosilenae]